MTVKELDYLYKLAVIANNAGRLCNVARGPVSRSDLKKVSDKLANVDREFASKFIDLKIGSVSKDTEEIAEKVAKAKADLKKRGAKVVESEKGETQAVVVEPLDEPEPAEEPEKPKRVRRSKK